MTRRKAVLSMLLFMFTLSALLLRIYGYLGLSFGYVFLPAVIVCGIWYKRFAVIVGVFYAAVIVAVSFALSPIFSWEPIVAASSVIVSAFCVRFCNKADLFNDTVKCAPPEKVHTPIAAREQALERLMILSEATFEGVMMHKELIIEDCNQAFLKIFGTSEEVIGKSLLDFILSEDRALVQEAQKSKNSKPYTVRAVRKDGGVFYAEIEMRNLMINNEFYRAGAIRDISERKAKEDEIINLSNLDHLTKLYNRSFFERTIGEYEKNGGKYALIIADINGLKLINDSFGHMEGDRFLKCAADILKKSCGDNGTNYVARFGGDEFIVFLPEENMHRGEEYIKLAQEMLSSTDGAVQLSMSFGYASKQRDDQSVKDVLKIAEDGMDRWKLYESASVRNKAIKIILSTLYEKSSREMLHSRRVGKICERIARAMELGEEDIRRISVGGLMHDIGKIGIEEGILNKPSKLTPAEYDEMKRHSEIGYRILSSSEEFFEVAGFVLYHHERWGGSGYPKGLKGEEIPLFSRIIAVADAYDAMVTDRPYRKGLTQAEAIIEIKKCIGSQFDPKIAGLFVDKVLKALDQEIKEIDRKISEAVDLDEE